MYDENELYNEMAGSVKSGVQTGMQLKDWIEKLSKSSQTEETVIKDFVFTGQSTDLRYFQNVNSMPIDLIEQIPNEQLKSAVMDNFNKAIADGKLSIDLDTKTLHITEKGKEFISRPEFRSAAAQDLQTFTQNRMQTFGVELDGTMQDLGFFQFSDKLDLAEVMQGGNTDTFFKIADNMQSMANKGWVVIDKSIVTITEKGKEMLGSEMMKTAFSGMTEKAISAIPGVGVAGKIFVATKKILSVGANTLGNTLKQ